MSHAITIELTLDNRTRREVVNGLRLLQYKYKSKEKNNYLFVKSIIRRIKSKVEKEEKIQEEKKYYDINNR